LCELGGAGHDAQISRAERFGWEPPFETSKRLDAKTVLGFAP